MASIHSKSYDALRMSKSLETCDYRKVVVLGATGVGKTAIIHRFLHDTYPEQHMPTIEQMYTAVYDLSGSSLKLDILDTSGYYEFPEMRRLAIKTGDVFLLVYSIHDPESFRFVSNLRELIQGMRQSGVPIVVVGNKCDLEDSMEVSKDVTESIVTIDWENGFVEASAKDNVNISRIFKVLLEQAHICCDLDRAMEQRRQSLPAYYPNRRNSLHQRRDSCTHQ